MNNIQEIAPKRSDAKPIATCLFFILQASINASMTGWTGCFTAIHFRIKKEKDEAGKFQ
jgi:hypothetical protein